MDIRRPSNARAKMIRKIVFCTVAILVLGGLHSTLQATSRGSTVDKATVWTDE